MGAELFRAECAVDPHAHQIGVGDALPAGFDRLRGERSAPLKHRERGHHRNPHSLLAKHLINRKQAGLEHQRVKRRFRQQEIDAPFEQRHHLLLVVFHHLIVGDIAVARIGDIAGDRELLVGGADRAGDKPGTIGGFGGGGISRLAGELGGGEIQLAHPISQAKVGQGQMRGAKRIGFHDVGARLEVGGVDPPDRVPLREHQNIDAVFQVARMIAKHLAAEALLVEREGMHHRAHGAIEHQDALGEEVAKELLSGFSG